MNGRQEMFICAKKIRIDNLDLGYSVIADADSKSLTVINIPKRLRFRQPIDRIVSKIGRASIYANIETPALSAWKRCKDEQLIGFKGVCYCCVEKTSEFSGRGRGGYLSGKRTPLTVTHVIIYDMEIPLSKSLSNVINDFQGTPQLGGVPIKMQNQYSDNSPTIVQFDTLKMSRQKHSAKLFAIDPSYKEAKQITQVTTGDSSLLEELLGGKH